MAIYRKVQIENAQGVQDWWLVYPDGPLEALRMAWSMWRMRGKVPALMRIPDFWTSENLDPPPTAKAPETTSA